MRGVGCFQGGDGCHGPPMCFRPLAGCGLFPKTTRARISLPGFRPLAGCGLFLQSSSQEPDVFSFRPLAGCGLFPASIRKELNMEKVSVPLRGVGCFESLLCRSQKYKKFPSPCGVWVVSGTTGPRPTAHSFRPLAGCGLFRRGKVVDPRSSEQFPSPCGVWVVSRRNEK